MKQELKAYLVTIVMFIVAAFVYYISTLITGGNYDTGNVACVFTFLVAVEFFTDKYTRK